MKTVSHVFAIVVAVGFCPAIQADHHDKPVDLAGVWNAEASSEGNIRKITWTFKKEGDKLTGISLDQENGNERNLDRVTVKDKTVILEIDVEQDGNKGVIRVEAEEKAFGKLVGKWSIVGDDGTAFMDGDLSAVKEVAFAGEWKATSVLPNGTDLETVLQLAGKNSALKGSIDGAAGETKIDKISIADGQLRLEFDFDMNGNTINCVIKSEAKGNDKLAGKWVIIGEDGAEAAEGEWSAIRKPAGLAGTWDVVAAVPDSADYNGTLTLTQTDGAYAGTSQGNNGDATTLKTAKVDGKSLEFSVPFDQGDFAGTITVKAKQNDDGTLQGEWVLIGDDGTELARESWEAKRK